MLLNKGVIEIGFGIYIVKLSTMQQHSEMEIN